MNNMIKRFNNSKAICYILLVSGIFLICLCSCIMKLGVRPDTDILWHYKLGGDILHTKTLSLDNPYTFLKNTEWVPHEWLYEVIVYGIFSVTGAIGFCVLYALNRIFLFGITYKLNKTKSFLLYLMTFVLLYTVFPQNRGNRPSEFSMYFVLFMFYFYWSTSKYKRLWYIGLGVFVANFHGGIAMVMIVVHIILMATDVVVDVYERSFHSKSYYNKHIIDIVLFTLSCFVNPAGYKLFINSILVSFAFSTHQISEWLPFSFDYISIFCVVLMVISFGYALYKTKFGRLDVQKIGSLCALLILSCVSQKAFILYFVVYLVFGYNYLYDMFSDICKVLKDKWVVPEKLEATPKMTRNVKLLIINYAAIVLCISGFVSNRNDLNNVKYSGSFTEWLNSFYSNEILTELKNNYTPDTKILTSYTYGNLLILNDMKCFVDARQWCYAKEMGSCGAVDELFYLDEAVRTDKEAIDCFLNKYDFDYIWTNRELPLSVYLDMSDGYERVCVFKSKKGSLSNIYKRDTSSYECLYKKIDD